MGLDEANPSDGLVDRGPLRVSSRARAVVDAASMLPAEDARALVIEAVQRRLVRLDDLVQWVEARPPNGRVLLRRALAEAAVGTWSLPEADLLSLVRRSAVVPEPWSNPELCDLDGRCLTSPDLWFDDVAMAVMVHSRRFHAGALQWDTTVAQDSDLTSRRVVVVGVTPTQISSAPLQVLRRIESAYLRARESAFRPAVIATRRSTWASA